MNYKHTQVGYLMIVLASAVFFFFTWLYWMSKVETTPYDSAAHMAVTAIMGVILVILSSFTTLTVVVDHTHLRLKFGYGIVRKTVVLKEIASANIVKNHWYYGWGIRVWFWPKMWIYNISGFAAVEIVLKNGNVYRIGTDEPEALLRALASHINA